MASDWSSGQWLTVAESERQSKASGVLDGQYEDEKDEVDDPDLGDLATPEPKEESEPKSVKNGVRVHSDDDGDGTHEETDL